MATTRFAYNFTNLLTFFTEGAQWRLPYGVSKIGITVMTYIFNKEYEKNDVLVLCVCPGFVSTDMNQHKGNLPVEEGTYTTRYLSMGDFDEIKNKNEYFWAEKKPWNWYNSFNKS